MWKILNWIMAAGIAGKIGMGRRGAWRREVGGEGERGRGKCRYGFH